MDASLQARRTELLMSTSLQKANACLYSVDPAAEDVRGGSAVRRYAHPTRAGARQTKRGATDAQEAAN